MATCTNSKEMHIDHGTHRLHAIPSMNGCPSKICIVNIALEKFIVTIRRYWIIATHMTMVASSPKKKVLH